MTARAAATDEKTSDSVTAWKVRSPAPMRVVCVAFAALSLLAVPARADNTGPTVTCSATTLLNLQMALVVEDTSNNVTEIQPASENSVLDQGECLCNSGDLAIELKATTAFPLGTQETFEVWVGSACDNYASRIGTTATCEKVSTPLTTSNFIAGAAGPVYQRFPVPALLSPNAHSCGGGSTGNGIYFIFYKNVQMPDAVCSIVLTSQVTPPPAPTGVQPSSGDGAVSLSWTSDLTGIAQKYQLLCADSQGNPVPGKSGHDAAYTTCTKKYGTERRTLATGGNVSVGTDDGGVAVPGTDAGTMSAPIGIDDQPVDGGTSSSPDMMLPPTSAPGVLGDLDHMFICSDPFEVNVTSTRIDGLTNGTDYQFVVVAVDANGNPSPSPVVNATPQPVDDLYRRLREAGGVSQGFCFIATAAHGSYQSPYVRVLRDFRDEELLTTEGGRSFVSWYYDHSPPAARWIAAHEDARAATRLALWPVIALAWLWLTLGPLGILALALALALAVSRRQLAAILRSRA